MTTPTEPTGFPLSCAPEISTRPTAMGGYSALSSLDKREPSTLSGALAYADAGIPILPAARTPDGKKKPLIRDWYNRASAYGRTIELWWEQYPHAVIGLPTGYRTGFIAVDVDPRNGGNETLATLPELPITRTHTSASRGRHFLFRYQRPLRTCVLGPGVDLKGDRGFIVVPPSPGYVKIIDMQPVELPAWILDCVSAPQGWGFGARQGEVCGQTNNTDRAHPLGGSQATSEQIVAVDNPESWATSILLYCANDVRNAEYGQRNSTLNKKAYKLGGYIAGGYLNEATVRRQLTQAATYVGLSREEIQATLNSALAAGKARPIRLQQLRLGGD